MPYQREMMVGMVEVVGQCCCLLTMLLTPFLCLELNMEEEEEEEEEGEMLLLKVPVVPVVPVE
jgi:hypothetical protein